MLLSGRDLLRTYEALLQCLAEFSWSCLVILWSLPSREVYACYFKKLVQARASFPRLDTRKLLYWDKVKDHLYKRHQCFWGIKWVSENARGFKLSSQKLCDKYCDPRILYNFCKAVSARLKNPLYKIYLSERDVADARPKIPLFSQHLPSSLPKHDAMLSNKGHGYAKITF